MPAVGRLWPSDDNDDDDDGGWLSDDGGAWRRLTAGYGDEVTLSRWYHRV